MTPFSHLTACLLVSGLLSIPAAPAQDLRVDWFTLDGGGGPMTGATFALDGTLGQPDSSGVLAGDRFSVRGGFWTLALVQDPDAPRLQLDSVGPTSFILFWDSSPGSYRLQASSSLVSTNWVDVYTGTNTVVEVPFDLPMRFFRLNDTPGTVPP